MAVKWLSIHHLGGVAQSLEIEFTPDQTSGAASLLLFGDNGSGKSSIVDALEFGLQARVGSTVTGRELYELVRSHGADSSPHVELHLDDGEIVERCFKTTGGVGIRPHTPHTMFSLAPIALRRSDLSRFWETPEQQRQVLFRGFFEAPAEGGWMRLGVSEEKFLSDQREKLKEARRGALAMLVDPLNLSAKQVPLESLAAFDRFVRASFPDSFGHNWPTSGPKSDEKDRERFEAGVEVRRLTRTILYLQSRLRHARAAPLGQTALASVLSSAASELSRAFSLISPASSFIASISLVPGGVGDVSLKIRAELVNGRQVSPEDVLSEASLDLLAILVFTSILGAAAEQGQAKVLILDDVIQSVDAEIRSRLLEYLLEQFGDWQLVLTTHDRLWREQVARLFAAAQKPLDARDIVRWSLAEGPVLRRSNGRNRERLAASLADGDDAVSLCSRAGLLLEELCQELSWRLPVSVKRTRHDRYTLGDLWPSVATRLDELGAQEFVSDVERYANLRNLVGAHHTEPGQTVSDVEAREYARAVLILWDAVNCEHCHGWIVRRGSQRACSCGRTVLRTE